jgi:three-Cys-motif partner protein
LAKHAILQRYLEAWFPILTRQSSAIAQRKKRTRNREILYIDGFAGPGEYSTGEVGSPIIALNAALGHVASFPVPVRMLFVEANQERFENLQRVLQPLLNQVAESPNIKGVEPTPGDCDAVLNARLDECESKGISFGPALAFLDQFGYGEVSMRLISRILAYRQCEVFSYLDYKDMNRFITDPNKASAISRAFGGEEWRQATHLPERERRTCLLNLYKAALTDPSRGSAKYVVAFSMFDKQNQPLYWLVFCTNNLRGLEEMKKAMWKIDATGEFRFSDQDDPNQLALFNMKYNEEWLSEELAQRLAGKTMTASKVKEYVLVETPCYLFKEALKKLERGKNKRLVVTEHPPSRRAGAYLDEHLDSIEVRFASSLFGS